MCVFELLKLRKGDFSMSQLVMLLIAILILIIVIGIVIYLRGIGAEKIGGVLKILRFG